VNTTTITTASENDNSPAVSDTAGRSNKQTIASTIKGLFRQAVKAVTRRDDDDEPTPPKRRKGERQGEFQRFAAILARPFNGLRAAFKGRTSITRRDTMSHDDFPITPTSLSDTLDCMNPFWPPIADLLDDIDEDLSVQQDPHFPHL
jgi:hypothetical protein